MRPNGRPSQLPWVGLYILPFVGYADPPYFLGRVLLDLEFPMHKLGGD